jgi:hypothetical protein
MKKYLQIGAMLVAALLVGGLAGSGVASAQVPPLPQVSPSERMVDAANRALRAQELRQQQQKAFQFELNALRAEQLRQQQFPRLVAPGHNLHCSTGTPGC